MEGTRNERAITVIASYAIGFTSAFILYSSAQVMTQEVFITVPEQKASVVLSQTPDEPKASLPAIITYTDGRLEVMVNNETKLLSFNPELSDFNVDLNTLSQGFHYGEIKYSLSQDNNFVFFCERQVAETESCKGYVYEVSEDKIYPVTKEGNSVTISSKSAETATWSERGLTIGANY